MAKRVAVGQTAGTGRRVYPHPRSKLRGVGDDTASDDDVSTMRQRLSYCCGIAIYMLRLADFRSITKEISSAVYALPDLLLLDVTI